MDKVYLVTYDLKGNRDYTELYNALKASSGWWHYLESSWLIKSEETAEGVWKRLASEIAQGDRLLIIEVRDNVQGWLPKKAWEWIHENVPSP